MILHYDCKYNDDFDFGGSTKKTKWFQRLNYPVSKANWLANAVKKLLVGYKGFMSSFTTWWCEKARTAKFHLSERISFCKRLCQRKLANGKKILIWFIVRQSDSDWKHQWAEPHFETSWFWHHSNEVIHERFLLNLFWIERCSIAWFLNANVS